MRTINQFMKAKKMNSFINLKHFLITYWPMEMYRTKPIAICSKITEPEMLKIGNSKNPAVLMLPNENFDKYAEIIKEYVGSYDRFSLIEWDKESRIRGEKPNVIC